MLAVSHLTTLYTCPLFEGLAAEDLDDLSRHIWRRRVSGGVTFMRAEEPGDGVYIVETGSVKVHVEQVDGTDVILAILGPGQVLGELSVVDAERGRSASAIALEDCTLLWLDGSILREYIDHLPRIAVNLTRLVSQRLRVASSRIESLVSADVSSRIAREILALADEYGQATGEGDVVIPVRLTQSDLADLVGASRARVNQTLMDYRKNRYLSVSKKRHITIHNRAALAECSSMGCR